MRVLELLLNKDYNIRQGLLMGSTALRRYSALYFRLGDLNFNGIAIKLAVILVFSALLAYALI